MRNSILFHLKLFLLQAAFFTAFGNAFAQKTVWITENTKQHIFSFKEIEQLEDPNGKLTFEDVLLPQHVHSFKPSVSSTPKKTNKAAVHWYRISIDQKEPLNMSFLLEFFDQTIDDIVAYIPNQQGGYHSLSLGDRYSFDQRPLLHKNFEILLENIPNQKRTFYFRIQSQQSADVILVLRSVPWFIQYATTEYFSFGVFYGMIAIFSFYNLLMFVYIRQRQYLYYVFYNISIAIYEMSADGIAYQFFWPNSPHWNQIAYAVALCAASVFALLFSQRLLQVKEKAPSLHRLINLVIILRIALFIISFFFNQDLFKYKVLEIIPLTLAYGTGIYIYLKGYKPARYFVLGYSFLFCGFLLKFLISVGFDWFNVSALSYYGLSISFVLEMMFLSLAIGDKVRWLKQQKDLAQQETIKQMGINAELKDNLNKELGRKVAERTREVFEKSAVIEAQNIQLTESNRRLAQQAEEISKMNALLANDNHELKVDIEKVTRARVMSTQVGFEEFSKIYPDKESCFAFLATLKWSNGYQCKKCGTSDYIPGHTSHSRRCKKCGYEESVLIDTIFQNSRISITKSFYMVFLIYSSQGKISSHKLSEILGIRQNTCLNYGHKIKKVMESRKKELKNAGDMGWSRLVLS